MKKIIVSVIITALCFALFGLEKVQGSVYASAYGFTYDTAGYSPVGWNTNKVMYVNYNTRTVGATTVNAGYYKLNEIYEEQTGIDVYVILTRITVTPMSTSVYSCGLFNWFRCQDFGWSENLNISSEIDYYASGANNQLMYYGPISQATTTSYTVGLGLEYGPDGFGGGISASTTFLDKDLDIINHSNSVDKFYSTEYNYKLPTFTWESDLYFRTETFQYSMYIIENPSSATFFSNLMEIYAKFTIGTSNGKYNSSLYATNNTTYYKSHTK